MQKPYQQLTTRGQAQRLRLLALKALEQYDLKVLGVRLITNDFNGIFRIDVATGEKYVLRVALPEGGHDIGNLRSEMIWLDALSRDTDLSVPRPLATRDGELVIQVACEGVPEPRMCMIFGWVPGTDLAGHLTQTNMRKLGYLMAQLHAHAATFKPSADFGDGSLVCDIGKRYLWLGKANSREKVSGSQILQVNFGSLHGAGSLVRAT